MARFGIAPAVATRDFTAYRELAPGNLDFDGSRKLYLPAESFTPCFHHDPDRVLSALASGFGDGDDRPGAGYLPCALPVRLNRPALPELAVVSRAIHRHQVLQVRYHSLRRGATDRAVIPHALVDSGLRWHVRAFDRKSGEFRDLVLSRIEQAVALPEHVPADHELGTADTLWNAMVDLVLVVHPGVARPEIVRRDFGMSRGEISLRVRAAVASYVLQLWNVDCSPDRRLDPLLHRLCLRDAASLSPLQQAAVALAPGAG